MLIWENFRSETNIFSLLILEAQYFIEQKCAPLQNDFIKEGGIRSNSLFKGSLQK